MLLTKLSFINFYYCRYVAADVKCYDDIKILYDDKTKIYTTVYNKDDLAPNDKNDDITQDYNDEDDLVKLTDFILLVDDDDAHMPLYFIKQILSLLFAAKQQLLPFVFSAMQLSPLLNFYFSKKSISFMELVNLYL